MGSGLPLWMVDNSFLTITMYQNCLHWANINNRWEAACRYVWLTTVVFTIPIYQNSAYEPSKTNKHIQNGQMKICRKRFFFTTAVSQISSEWKTEHAIVFF